MKDAFVARVAPISDAVRALGGEINDAVWLNQSLAVRLPAKSVVKLQDVDGISLLDVPHRLQRE